MKILLADDHELFRAGLREMLRQLDAQAQIIEACTCAEMIAAAGVHPDLSMVLLDLHMPDAHGLTALETLKQRHVMLPVVVLSASERREEMQRALDLGALGFIPKSDSSAVMINALRLILAGGIYVPARLVQPAGNADSPRTGAYGDLSGRQLDILARVIQGKANKVIAAELALTEATIKAHITAIFRALRVSNRMQAARAAKELNLKLPDVSP